VATFNAAVPSAPAAIPTRNERVVMSRAVGEL